jgi:hypothetical protein
VLFAARWVQSVQQFMHDDGELVPPTQSVVNQDPGPLALLAERVAVGTTLKASESDEPTLVAIQGEVVIFHGLALSLTTVAGASTNPDLAAEVVQCRLSLGTPAVAAGKFAHPLLGDADGGQAGSHHVAQAQAGLRPANAINHADDFRHRKSASGALHLASITNEIALLSHSGVITIDHSNLALEKPLDAEQLDKSLSYP